MSKKSTLYYLFCFSLIALMWLSAGTAHSQSVGGQTIPWDVLEGGGGKSHSANYVLLSSISQATAIGSSSGGQYQNYAGFEIGGTTSDFVILGIEDREAKPGETNVPVRITLDNAAMPVSALQFRLKYDADIGIYASGGSSGFQLTDRTQGFNASVNVTGNGANSEMLVLLYSLSGDAIPAGTGAILELLFTVDPTATPGDTSLVQFTECVVSDAAGQELLSEYADTATFTIEDPYEPEDINRDGNIDVLDLQALINCITTSGSCEHCDLNADEQYNIFDIQLLINAINNPTGNGSVANHGQQPALFGVSTLTLPGIYVEPGTTGTFGLGLSNSEVIASGQLTLAYDSTNGFDINGVALSSRTEGFYEPVFYKDAGDPTNVKILVLYFSLSGAAITPGSGDILEFTYQTAPDASGMIDITLLDSLLAKQNGESVGGVKHESGTVMMGEQMPYTVAAFAGEGGIISPSGTLTFDAGTTQTFTILPASEYRIADVLVDGVSVGIVSKYSFTAIDTDHSIEAIFRRESQEYSFLRDAWNDAEKSLTNPDDDWMCWAAAAANILEWSGWGTEIFDTAQEIFSYFQDSWTNAGGLMEYGWNWWFDGSQAPDWPGWSQLNEGWAEVETGGAYWADYNFFDYFSEDWALWDADSGTWSGGAELMASVEQYLSDDYGVSLAVYNESGGHALSAWGYEYDEYGDYAGIWVTDSDDYDNSLKLLSLTFDFEEELWYLDFENRYNYQGWFIGGTQALGQNPAQNPVPEPGTLALWLSGVIVVAGLRKRLLSRKP